MFKLPFGCVPSFGIYWNPLPLFSQKGKKLHNGFINKSRYKINTVKYTK